MMDTEFGLEESNALAYMKSLGACRDVGLY